MHRPVESRRNYGFVMRSGRGIGEHELGGRSAFIDVVR